MSNQFKVGDRVEHIGRRNNNIATIIEPRGIVRDSYPDTASTIRYDGGGTNDVMNTGLRLISSTSAVLYIYENEQ